MAKKKTPTAERIEKWHVDRLTPYDRNPRTHSKEQIDQIAASIVEFGFLNPILVDSSTGIIAGHGRLQAAKKIGLSQVPVIVFDHLTDAQRRAYVIADNKLALNAGWDEDLLRTEMAALADEDFDLPLTGFSDDELAELLGEGESQESGEDEDEVPAPPAKPITAKGDVWRLGNHRLLCGDSTDAAALDALFQGRAADLCFTSPPYGVGLDYGSYIDSFENCRQLLRGVAPVIWARLRAGGFCVTNFGDIISGREINKTAEPSEYPMALEYWPAFTGAGFVLNSRRVWAKPHAKVAAPWTASSNRAASDWEHLWFWLKPGEYLNERRDPSYLGVWDTGEEKRYGAQEGVEVGKDIHPAAFPVGIARLVLEVYSNRGDVVFEPFAGTGTVIIAAEKMKRDCFAVELDPGYCDLIIRRFLKNFPDIPALRESDGRDYQSLMA